MEGHRVDIGLGLGVRVLAGARAALAGQRDAHHRAADGEDAAVAEIEAHVVELEHQRTDHQVLGARAQDVAVRVDLDHHVPRLAVAREALEAELGGLDAHPGLDQHHVPARPQVVAAARAAIAEGQLVARGVGEQVHVVAPRHHPVGGDLDHHPVLEFGGATGRAELPAAVVGIRGVARIGAAGHARGQAGGRGRQPGAARAPPSRWGGHAARGMVRSSAAAASGLASLSARLSCSARDP